MLVVWSALSVSVATPTAPVAATEGSDGRFAHGCTAVAVERPYVCDVGEPKALSRESFSQILEVDAGVRAMVARIGMPSYAELQEVDVDEPWMSYELRVYYLAYGKMMVFGRAMILGNPQISLLRHEGSIPAAKRARLASRVVAGPFALATQ